MGIAFRTSVLFVRKNYIGFTHSVLLMRAYLETPKKYYNFLNFCLKMLKKANLIRIICRGK